MYKSVVAFLIFIATNTYASDERFIEKYVFNDREVIIDSIPYMLDDPSEEKSYVYVDGKKIYTANGSGLSLHSYKEAEKIIILSENHIFYSGVGWDGYYVVILLGWDKSAGVKVSDAFGNCSFPTISYSENNIIFTFAKNSRYPAMKFMVTSSGKFIKN